MLALYIESLRFSPVYRLAPVGLDCGRGGILSSVSPPLKKKPCYVTLFCFVYCGCAMFMIKNKILQNNTNAADKSLHFCRI